MSAFMSIDSLFEDNDSPLCLPDITAFPNGIWVTVLWTLEKRLTLLLARISGRAIHYLNVSYAQVYFHSWSVNRWENSWWRHQMDTFSALLALCEGISPVPAEFHSQRPVSWSFGVFFDLCLDKRSCKQSRRRWLETPSRSLQRHCNGISIE